MESSNSKSLLRNRSANIKLERNVSNSSKEKVMEIKRK